MGQVFPHVRERRKRSSIRDVAGWRSSKLLVGLVLGVVCVFCVVFSSHSFWTSMDVPAGVTQEEGNTGFSIHLLSAVLALFFLARRIQPFLSLVDREVEFCVLTN